MTKKVKVARIGNSRGVRIPAEVLKRYRIEDDVLMEELEEGILLRPAGRAAGKLSWEETAREMAKSREDWSIWDSTVGDGLEDLPWKERSRVAEQAVAYQAKAPRGKRR